MALSAATIASDTSISGIEEAIRTGMGVGEFLVYILFTGFTHLAS